MKRFLILILIFVMALTACDALSSPTEAPPCGADERSTNSGSSGRDRRSSCRGNCPTYGSSPYGSADRNPASGSDRSASH